MEADAQKRSAVFATFLTSLEKVSRGISDRSYADQEKVLAMGSFVQGLAHWRVFGTFTFRWSASVNSARRCFERFVKGAVPNMSTFYAIELHPGGHGGHIHALFDRDDFPRVQMWRQWHKRFGINRIEPVNGYQDVCDYCSKYVVKDHAWWNFSLSRAAFQKWRELGKQNSPHFPLGEFSGSSVSVEPLHQGPRAVGVTNI